MSAFILSEYHLSILGRAISASRLYLRNNRNVLVAFDASTAKKFAQMLYEQNVRSVAYRYHEETSDYERYLVFDERALQGTLDPVQVLKAAQSYDYQACETDDYEETQAARLIREILDSFITALPGYEEAQWTL